MAASALVIRGYAKKIADPHVATKVLVDFVDGIIPGGTRDHVSSALEKLIERARGDSSLVPILLERAEILEARGMADLAQKARDAHNELAAPPPAVEPVPAQVDEEADTRRLPVQSPQEHMCTRYPVALAAHPDQPAAANQRTIAEALKQDPEYQSATDESRKIAIAKRYAQLLETVERTGAEIARGRYVDVVTNARMIIPVGDVHGDVYGLIDQGIRSGFLAEVPECASLAEKYVLNPDLPAGTQIVFMGDLIDRGTTSAEVIGIVRAMADAAETRNNGTHVHVLRGNHESIFFRFLDLYRDLTIGEAMQILGVDMQPLLGDTGLLNKPPQELVKTLVDAGIPEKLARLLVQAASEGIVWYAEKAEDDIHDVGVNQTLTSIVNKYGLSEADTLQTAIDRMEEDGTLAFLHSMRGAVIIDSAYFTHGGPVLSDAVISAADRRAAVEALGQHFADCFHDSENDLWAYVYPGTKSWELYQKHTACGDRSIDYAKEWHTDARLGTFMSALGVSHIYVGHEKAKTTGVDSVRRYGEHVTCVDANLSNAYGAGDGILILDPLRKDGVARVIRGRSVRETNGGWVELRPAIETDFTGNRARTAILDNPISQAAARTYGEVAPVSASPETSGARLPAPPVVAAPAVAEAEATTGKGGLEAKIRIRLKPRDNSADVTNAWLECISPGFGSLPPDQQELILDKVVVDAMAIAPRKSREVLIGLPLAMAALSSGDPKRRVIAAKQLGRLGTFVAERQRKRIQNELIVKLCSTQTTECSIALLDALARIGDYSIVEYLERSEASASIGTRGRYTARKREYEKARQKAIRKITARLTRQNAGGSFWLTGDALRCYAAGASLISGGVFTTAALGSTVGITVGVIALIPVVALSRARAIYKEKYKPREQGVIS